MTKKNQEIMLLNQITLSLLTTPFLLGLMTFDWALQVLQQLGESTEELFRGSRLPLLYFSQLKNDNLEHK